MLKREVITKHFDEEHDESLALMHTIDEFDDAVLGADSKTGRFIYSVHKCIDILMDKNQLTQSQAYDIFEHRFKNLHIGHGRPIWCDDEAFNTYIRDEETKRDTRCRCQRSI